MSTSSSSNGAGNFNFNFYFILNGSKRITALCYTSMRRALRLTKCTSTHADRVLTSACDPILYSRQADDRRLEGPLRARAGGGRADSVHAAWDRHVPPDNRAVRARGQSSRSGASVQAQIPPSPSHPLPSPPIPSDSVPRGCTAPPLPPPPPPPPPPCVHYAACARCRVMAVRGVLLWTDRCICPDGGW